MLKCFSEALAPSLQFSAAIIPITPLRFQAYTAITGYYYSIYHANDMSHHDKQRKSPYQTPQQYNPVYSQQLHTWSFHFPPSHAESHPLCHAAVPTKDTHTLLLPIPAQGWFLLPFLSIHIFRCNLYNIPTSYCENTRGTDRRSPRRQSAHDKKQGPLIPHST